MTAPASAPATAAANPAVAAAQVAALSESAQVLQSLTDQVAAVRDQTSQWAKASIRRLWSEINPYDDKAVAQFAGQAADVMATAQSAMARAAAAAQARQLTMMGVRVKDVAPDVSVDVRGRPKMVDGQIDVTPMATKVEYADGGTAKIRAADMTTVEVFKRPAVTFRYVDAGASQSDPAQAAGLRIDTLVDDNLMLAQRKAAQDVIAGAVDLDRGTAKIIGYRRVIHPELSRSKTTCGLCIAASDRLYYVKEPMPIHTRCHCDVAAVTEDADPAAELNAVDLGELYRLAKGKGSYSRSALSNVRYTVDEHGELGPVLKPARAAQP